MNDVDLDAEGYWDLSDIVTYGEIAVRSSLRADFNVIRDKCVQYLVEVRPTAADVFKFALRALNSVGKQ